MRWAIAMAGLALAGCQTTREPGPRPENVRALMKDYVKSNFFDPYSMRDVEIGEPELLSDAGGWGVCFKANAKNRMGGYVGLTTIVYLVRDGKVIESIDGGTAERFCATRKLAPWNPQA